MIREVESQSQLRQRTCQRDILTPMDFRERLRTGRVARRGFRRFGKQIGNMRDVRDHSDLAQLQAAGAGFILNIREDRKMLHQAGCEAIEVMSSTAYDKVFFETSDEATQWLNTNLGDQGWTNCGLCGGARFIHRAP